MNCDRLREVLIEHVDGLLDAEDAEGAREHLAHCAACAELREEVRLGFGALDAWEDEDLPDGAWERMCARLPAVDAASADAAPAAAAPSPSTPAPPFPRSAAAPAAPSLRTAGLPYLLGLATAAAVIVAVQPLFPPGPSADPALAAPQPAGVGGPPAVEDPLALRPSAELPADPVGGIHRLAAEGGTTPASREPGEDFVEKPLRFADFDNGVVREIRIPDGVDPDEVVVEPVQTPSRPSRQVR